MTEVVPASDGYPAVPPTLAEAERLLADGLERDPTCVGVLRGTKGVLPDTRSFDDRAWVRVRLPAAAASTGEPVAP